ncbi:MAG: hypothetical protein C3F11_01900 [Methylocystaceae bacterium]|nr:MAG: hypothetical protein C3F11_01900 [Methylocystaceae bacterium]
MHIGLDMARLALRETVRAIVVVTGGSDFVLAFKFVRREGESHIGLAPTQCSNGVPGSL